MTDSPDLKRNVGKIPMAERWLWFIYGFSMILLIFGSGRMNMVAAQQNGISSPAAGDTLSGVVAVSGTAVHPDFLRYELAFLNEANQSAGWIVFAEGSQPVTENALAVWDTTVGQNVGAAVFPDGRYQLRLRVVRSDYNYDEYLVTGLAISNAGPTPIPTPDETALAVTATAMVGQPGEQQPEEGTAVFNPLTPLPSLTPFPTITPQATPVTISEDVDTLPPESTGGVFGQIETVDTSRFAQAFWNGVRLTVAIFLLLAAYLLLRKGGRWVWRKFWSGR